MGFIKERTDPREIASSCSYRALLEISPWRSTISQRIHERRTPKRKGYIQLIPNPVHQNRSGRAPATKIPKLVPKPHPKVLIRIILFLRSPSTPAAPPPNPDHHHHCTLFELSCTLLPEPGTRPTTSRALQLTGVLAKREVEKIEAFCCHCSSFCAMSSALLRVYPSELKIPCKFFKNQSLIGAFLG